VFGSGVYIPGAGGVVGADGDKSPAVVAEFKGGMSLNMNGYGITDFCIFLSFHTVWTLFGPLRTMPPAV